MVSSNRESSLNRCVRVSMHSFAVAIPMLLLVHGSADAATPSACEPTALSSFDQRLVAKADEGATPLRRFVERTRAIHQLDMTEALQRVDKHREAVRACTVAVASRS